MKHFLALALAVVTALTVVVTHSAEAKRLGGGRTLGAQRQAMPAPAAPATPNVAASSAATPSQALPPGAANPASRTSRWLGPLAGLAAGLGLAALLSHFGLSEGFAGILMLVLLALAGLFLIRLLFARRMGTPLHYAGAGTGADVPAGAPRPEPTATSPVTRFEPVYDTPATVTASRSAAATFPEGFDPAPFVQQAKRQFRKLQSAYDSGDRKALADVMTPEMFAEIDREIAARGTHVATEVAELDATVLEVATEGDRHWASVHFIGRLREDGMVLAKPFDEIWNLVKPVDGRSGWLLAGIRQPA